MKTLNEVIKDERFVNLSDTFYNLRLITKGTHNADGISGLGRGFAETKGKRVIARVLVGTLDVMMLRYYLCTLNRNGVDNGITVDDLVFKFSRSGSKLYLYPTEDIYNEIVEAMKFWPEFQK